MLTERQICILKLLHQKNEYLTISQIAAELFVSAKTVRNDLEEIKKHCQVNQAGTIIARPGAGILLALRENEEERFFSSLQSKDTPLLFSHQLQPAIIQLLLQKNSVSYTALEKKLFVSRSTIDKALPGIIQWFHSQNIVCEKRWGKGIEIRYQEFHFRLALWQFFCFSKEPGELAESPGIKNDELLKSLLPGFDYQPVENAITQLEKSFHLVFSYEGHLQLVFLLSLSIIRTRKGFLISMPVTPVNKTDSHFNRRMGKAMVDFIENTCQLSLLPEEKSFICFLLSISDIQSFNTPAVMYQFQADSPELCHFTIKLSFLLSEITNIDLKTDEYFTESLLIQLRSMLPRLQYRIAAPHPLLAQVKGKYPNIFAAIYAAGLFFDKELSLEINENEMCSLALLLGGALERSSTLLTACVVCNYGIGVSRLLKERIERNISDLKILAVFSARDYRQIRSLNCDFIISTLPLDIPGNQKSMITVGHLLPACDIHKIEEKMRTIRKSKLRQKVKKPEMKLNRNLFIPEFIWLDVKAASKNEIIQHACKFLTDAGYVTDEFQASVFDHEEKAPTELGSGVAIPHGLAAWVVRPIVACIRLAEPVLWHEELVDLIFLLAFNLDEASGLKAETIKFYSAFLDLLESPKELSKVRNLEDNISFAAYMNKKIRGESHL